MSISWSIIEASASLAVIYCNHVVVSATSSNLCIMCCMNVLHECVVGCPILSSMYEHVPIHHRGVGIDLLLQSSMLFLVLRHPTCASCVAWMCCRMSNSCWSLDCTCIPRCFPLVQRATCRMTFGTSVPTTEYHFINLSFCHSYLPASAPEADL